jgi:hypothetical protein
MDWRTWLPEASLTATGSEIVSSMIAANAWEHVKVKTMLTTARFMDIPPSCSQAEPGTKKTSSFRF